jgi:hypothetical protein
MPPPYPMYNRPTMLAFQVSLNRKELCVAGLADKGVLTAIVNWVDWRSGADLFLTVGGLVSATEEHVSWISQKPLRVGSEIRVKVVETDSADNPIKRHRTDPAERLRSQKRYVRMMAKQLGWKIQTHSEPASS